MRDHVENDVNEEKVIVQPHRDEYYEPVPLHFLIGSHDQQDCKYEQIGPAEQGSVQNRHGGDFTLETIALEYNRERIVRSRSRCIGVRQF